MSSNTSFAIHQKGICIIEREGGREERKDGGRKGERVEREWKRGERIRIVLSQ